ncbi:hypothetical protein A2U01_0092267, partial [Trifolium medium]|nr:hypothetical protein [Trifolium medium]
MDQPSTSTSKRPGQHRPNDPTPTAGMPTSVVPPDASGDAAVDPPEQPVVMTMSFIR